MADTEEEGAWSVIETSKQFSCLSDAVLSLKSVPTCIRDEDLQAISGTDDNDNATLEYSDPKRGNSYRIQHIRKRHFFKHKCICVLSFKPSNKGVPKCPSVSEANLYCEECTNLHLEHGVCDGMMMVHGPTGDTVTVLSKHYDHVDAYFKVEMQNGIKKRVRPESLEPICLPPKCNIVCAACGFQLQGSPLDDEDPDVTGWEQVDADVAKQDAEEGELAVRNAREARRKNMIDNVVVAGTIAVAIVGALAEATIEEKVQRVSPKAAFSVSERNAERCNAPAIVAVGHSSGTSVGEQFKFTQQQSLFTFTEPGKVCYGTEAAYVLYHIQRFNYLPAEIPPSFGKNDHHCRLNTDLTNNYPISFDDYNGAFDRTGYSVGIYIWENGCLRLLSDGDLRSADLLQCTAAGRGSTTVKDIFRLGNKLKISNVVILGCKSGLECQEEAASRRALHLLTN